MLDPEEESTLSRKCLQACNPFTGCTVTTACKLPSMLVSSCLSVCLAGCMSVRLCFVYCSSSASDTRICGRPLQVKLLEGAQPSTTMKSQAGLGGGSLAATQQRGPATPGSPTQQTMKGFNKSGKGMTARPMGATLPVSLLLHLCLLRTTPVHVLLQCKPAVVRCPPRTKPDHLLLQSFLSFVLTSWSWALRLT